MLLPPPPLIKRPRLKACTLSGLPTVLCTTLALPPSPSPDRLGTSIAIEHRSEGVQMAKNRLQTRKKRTKRSRSQVIRIGVLPDDVLLEIFDFYLKKEDSYYYAKKEVETWQPLVHVCRRWRSVVFGSPHRLNLQLCCRSRTPLRDTLDVWPALPLIIVGIFLDPRPYPGMDDIIIALVHSNRVCEVHLTWIRRQKLELVLALMQVPFLELTELQLLSFGTPPVIPDSFLGGSAPRLRVFDLTGIPFPGLPKLLLSATRLVELRLFSIPHSGYISPEAMVAVLSVSSSLEKLTLRFASPQSRPDLESRRPPPLKRSIIPSLTRFIFEGVSEYLEDLVTCIDAPH